MGSKNEKKVIWFLNQNSYLPEDGPHIRHYTFGKYLTALRYEPFVFAANELHHNGRRIDTKGQSYIEKNRDGVHFLYIKTVHYEKNDIHRILNIVSYYRAVFKVAKEIESKYGKPDIIYASMMYPTALSAGIKLARKYGVKCICESRDLIPEGFVTKGTFKKDGILAYILSEYMKRIYYKADALVFTMEGGKQYLIDHHWDKGHGGKIDMSKVYYINNGVDLAVSNENAEKYVLDDEDLDDESVFKVVYFGAIRFMNQMPLFIETAECLKKHGYHNIKILMWGNGTKLEEMRNKLLELELYNIKLKGYVDKKYIPGIAKRADMFIATGNSCIVGKYGMSFNKLFDYLAGGKPIILPFKVENSIVEKNGAGVELENASGKIIAEELARFSLMDKEKYYRYCSNSLKLAAKFDYAVLTKKVEAIVNDLGSV